MSKKSPRRLITSLRSTAEYIVQSKRGFKHGEAENALFDRFFDAQTIQIEFSASLKEFSKQKTKQMEKEAQFVDSLNNLALRDGNKAVVRTSARKVKDTQKLGVWLEGFNTIVGISAELVKEMEGIAKKIEALNHQIADLEALRKDGDQKENATSLEKVYKAEKSQLVNEVNNCLKKKEELNSRWMDKLDVLDERLKE